ncbi:MAG TPA: DUF2795 domain-containing protein [Mycobacterium sp.]|nr:DUF2795 domain-containing protein [Mycobacterium sp.]
MGFQVTEVQRHLAGFGYPGTPHDLADHARDKGADETLVDTLRSLRKGSFDGLDAVIEELGSYNRRDELDRTLQRMARAHLALAAATRGRHSASRL